MKKQAFNPYLPTYEYVPDGEPRVFGDRLYVYGSHDRAHGSDYCENDYVCWSAPVDNLGDWRYEGVIFKKVQEPLYNGEDICRLYAPDVVQGTDGRFYLYYCMENAEVISVAVCDEPAGKYEFLGHVHCENGYEPGSVEGDWIQFDPAVLVDNDGRVFLYSGFNPFFPFKPNRTFVGAYVMELKSDMMTIIGEPVVIMQKHDEALGIHNFFEASSVRRIGDMYYFVYSSQQCVELCYATSAYPDRDFVYRGCIVSNTDVGVDGNTELRNHGGNNHGGMVQIGDKWYIFYHRPTNDTLFSRQGSAEEIRIEGDGSIKQVEMTSCGLNGGPLKGEGIYSAGVVCNIFPGEGKTPFLTQSGEDVDPEKLSAGNGFSDEKTVPVHRYGTYVAHIVDGNELGFKYFDIRDIESVRIRVRGHGEGRVCMSFGRRYGANGDYRCFFAEIPIALNDEDRDTWRDFRGIAQAEPGIYPIYISYDGSGEIALQEFELYAKKGANNYEG
ncbi:MAG: family 43 glycosylhydrolase [Acetatifactor sp.]|nr:family 43 glycosylhydrolase [Acetatifactor sp.]